MTHVTGLGDLPWWRRSPIFPYYYEGIVGDFLKQLPPADFYSMKRILHDWPDDKCVEILRNCKQAMQSSGEFGLIYVVDGMMPSDPDVSFNYEGDIMMMLIFGGAGQRTLGDFVRLAERAGLALVDAKKVDVTGLGVIAFRPA